MSFSTKGVTDWLGFMCAGDDIKRGEIRHQIDMLNEERSRVMSGVFSDL